MNISRKKPQVLDQIKTDNNTAACSNYNSVTQISSLHSRVQSLEASLELSLRNQKMLNENLEFMLEVEKTLRREVEERDNRIKHLEKQLGQKNSEFQILEQSLDAIKELLEESEAALGAANEKIAEKETLISRKDATIREQKKVVELLENEKLYNNLNGYDKTVKEEKEDGVYQLKEGYQKKVNELQYQLKRSENSCLAEKTKSDKLQKEVNDFKRWLCKLVGIDRIVAGCEKMVMNEVSKRLGG